MESFGAHPHPRQCMHSSRNASGQKRARARGTKRSAFPWKSVAGKLAFLSGKGKSESKAKGQKVSKRDLDIPRILRNTVTPRRAHEKESRTDFNDRVSGGWEYGIGRGGVLVVSLKRGHRKLEGHRQARGGTTEVRGGIKLEGAPDELGGHAPKLEGAPNRTELPITLKDGFSPSATSSSAPTSSS
ncbi:hypothetical protein H6P81_003717 [Aristolochia fimbriata]|uniref:Uncharacterized protein n=1 Tax=Aristolochia fimbriata TaxID=158543 RepID=A0AAV7FDW2_ARIFI|nr:hypothetical protein H6P81_003717 [Aristolochia fimbriata]